MKTSRLYKCLVTMIMVVFCVFGAYGVPSARYEGTSTNNHLHLGLEWQSMKGVYGYYNNARFRDPILAGTFFQQDPLSEKYYPYTPYHYGMNNPLRYSDYNGMFTIEGMNNNGYYPTIAIFPSNYVNDNALSYDYEQAENNNIPTIITENISDLSNALDVLNENSIKTSVFTLNSHGKPGQFHIGNDVVTAETDFSSLKNGFSNKTIFIGACNTTSDFSGEALIENMSQQTQSTVIGSNHKIEAGYQYDGSLFLNYPNKIPFLDDNNNKYMLSTNGDISKSIYNVRFTSSYLLWDTKK